MKGALSSMVISLYKICDMYRYGYYVPKDEKTAYRIYEHCNESITNSNVRQCGADVYMRIADCPFEGIDCEKMQYGKYSNSTGCSDLFSICF